MNRDGVLFDVGIGSLVTFVLSFVPFSPVLGGASVAARRDDGYLRGFALGLTAGVVAVVPFLAFLLPALAITGWLGVGVAPSSPAYGVFLGLVAAFFLLYTVGLSGLGALAGVWARRHTDWDIEPDRWL